MPTLHIISKLHLTQLFVCIFSCNSGVAVLGGLFIFAVCVFGTLFDTLTAVYFDQLPSKCSGLPLEDDRCYCSASENIFNEIFREVGDIDCYNPYTRETSYLIANAVLSGLCAVVALYLSVTTLRTCVVKLCGCGTSHHERLVN